MKFDVKACSSVEDAEGNVWIWDRSHNVIGYFYGENHEFHIANRYEVEKFRGFFIYLNQGVVYMTDQFETAVLTYNIAKDSFEMYRFDVSAKASQYFSSKLSGDRILMAACELKYPSVIFDMQSGQFMEVTLPKTELYRDKMISRFTSTDQEVICSLSDSNEILLMDNKDLSCRIRRINAIEDIGGIYANSADDMWIISKHGESLIRYFNGEETQIALGDRVEKDLFCGLVMYEDKLIALPRYAEKIYVYDKQRKEAERISMPKTIDFSEGRTSLFFSGYVKNGKMTFLPCRLSHYMLEMDLRTFDIKECGVNVAFQELYQYFPMELFWYETSERELSFLFEIVEALCTYL